MQLIRTIQDDYKTLRDGKPGDRFRNYVTHRRERRGSKFSFGRIANFAMGLALVIVGLAIGWLPGPGGFLAIIGLALVAQEIPVIADLLDKVEVWLRKTVGRIKGLFKTGGSSPTD